MTWHLISTDIRCLIMEGVESTAVDRRGSSSSSSSSSIVDVVGCGRSAIRVQLEDIPMLGDLGLQNAFKTIAGIVISRKEIIVFHCNVWEFRS